MNWLSLFSALSLSWSAYVLMWVKSLHGCDCADHQWQLVYIAWSYVALIMYDLFVLATGRHEFHFYAAFMAVTFALSAVTAQYIHGLDVRKCICSESARRRIIWLASLKQLVFVPLVLIFFVALGKKW